MELQELTDNASTEDIKKRINSLKIRALNLSSELLTNNNAQYLEAREIKTITDVILNMEDSISDEDSEGTWTRKAGRLLDKYGVTENSVPDSKQKVIDIPVKEYSNE